MDRGPALLCTEGLLAGQRFPITAEGLRIGREAGNEVHLDDAGVSRQHARVLLHNGAVWVQDAGSRNGIFVNGDRVPDHKQLKVGDRLTVGAHVFDVVAPIEAPARPAPPAAPAPVPRKVEKAEPRWKVWPFVVAVLLAAGFIACFGVFGALRDGGPSAAAPPAQPAYSLTTLLEPGATPGDAAAPPAAGGAPPPGAPTVAQALAVVAGADPTASLAAIPDPPAGTTPRQLLDTAQVNYDSGRLADARLQYQQAWKLDPTCQICTVRIARIDEELAAKVQQQFDAGMRAFDSMQYSQAIAAWETVLMLVPDPADPMHTRAAEYLQKAQAAAATPR